MKLYEIPTKIRAVLDGIDCDPETGEILNADALHAVEVEAAEKPTPCLKERCYEDSPLTHHGRHGHARNVSMKMTLPTNKYVAEILEEANIAPLEVSMAILERKSVQELAEMFKSYTKDATSDQLLLSAEVSRKIGEIMIASVDVFEFLAKEKNHENQD